MGYHYGPAAETVWINSIFPSSEAMVATSPTFVWTDNKKRGNIFVVDLMFSRGRPFLSSPEIYGKAHWTLPPRVWNRITSGKRFYWRIRGADLGQRPLNIISDEVLPFYKAVVRCRATGRCKRCFMRETDQTPPLQFGLSPAGSLNHSPAPHFP
jgi:hypothetical protein